MVKEKAFAYVLDGCVTALLLITVANPQGVVRTTVDAWREERRTLRVVEQSWTDLTRGGLRLGSQSQDAKILVEFGDYRCPFCKAAHPTLEQILRDHPQVAIVYRHLPLHEFSEQAALASICAEHQQAGHVFHKLMYESSWSAGEAPVQWETIATRSRVPDVSAFMRCMGDIDTKLLLDNDIELAQALRIAGTPAFVTPEGVLHGFQEEADLLRALGIDR